MRINLKLAERLSQQIHPLNYKLELRPNTLSGTFQGNVEIEFDVQRDRNYINLHSKHLDITEIKVFRAGEELTVSEHMEVKQVEQIFVYLENGFTPGVYTIRLKYFGDLSRNIVGFYSSRLQNGRTMVASKFQPTYARQAYPCFDEPYFKATYDITLAKPVNSVALSNMNEISKVHDAETNTDLVTFATSVPMSTYLACFVICDFESKSVIIDPGNIGSKFTLRAFAQKHELRKINFALDIATKATKFYITYYEVPFPLPKLDMIAIPDYVSGATEHWGLITYRETSFLIDEEHSSASNKISVANTIAHELAHMWFGNLVTMKWWDEVWLNEGFASYMQVKALDSIEPTWQILDHFLTKTMHSVLALDAKLSTHPIVQNVVTPDQITAIFDSISYNKGASILRMLEGFIGPEKFRLGVKDYLEKYKFGTTVTNDLLSSLEPYFKEEHPDMNVMEIMDTWTKQMGYPVVIVTPTDEANTFILSQKRFLIDHEAGNENTTMINNFWYVPITYRTAKGPKEKIIWMPNRDEKIKITLSSDETWLKINNNQVGYYRVNYGLVMWQNLIEQLKSNHLQFTISDRSHLLDDVFALAEARMLTYYLALNLTTYLPDENDLVPWETATAIYRSLEKKLQNTLAYDYLQKYFQRIIHPIYVEQKWEEKTLPVMESLLRTRILSLAARCRLPDAEERIKTMFMNWLQKKGNKDEFNIHQDLRDIVYFYGMKSATVREWDRLFEIYLNEDDVQEKLKLRNALAAPRDTTLLRKFLLLAWEEKNVRSQDYLNVLMQISANPSGTALVWDDVRARWPELVERFTLNSRYLANMIPSITSSFNTEIKYKELEAFFNLYPDAGAGELARRRALETIKSNIRWSMYNLSAVTQWLNFNHEATDIKRAA